jgi:hypothetical protein
MGQQGKERFIAFPFLFYLNQSINLGEIE